jgi:ABC-type branched-subunit amino acid transport system substrate-binding protein
MAPSPLDCSTIGDEQERYRVQVGPIEYYQRRFGDLHGGFILSGDVAAVRNAALPTVESWTNSGMKLDTDGPTFVSAVAPRPALTPPVQAIKEAGSTFVYLGIAVDSVVAFREEAKVQGVDSVKVWSCAFSCYDRRLLTSPDAVEGQFVTSATVPFEEARHSPALRRYLRAVGREEADGFGIQAWIAGLVFRDAVERVVTAHGENGLTRSALLDAIRDTRRFTADGILGATDIGAKRPTDCFLIMKVVDGEFVRAYPKKPGTFDCKAQNTRTIRLDLEQ